MSLGTSMAHDGWLWLPAAAQCEDWLRATAPSPRLAIYPSFRPVHDLHRQPMGCGHYTAIARDLSAGTFGGCAGIASGQVRDRTGSRLRCAWPAARPAPAAAAAPATAAAAAVLGHF